MPQPGQPSARGDDWLVRKVQDLEQKLQQLAAANVFGTTGITPQDGGTQFDGYANFNGNMKVTGTLELPAGIIGNDALANPLTTGSAGYTASNQSFSTAATVYGTQTITVPSGFTKAVVMNGVSGGGSNSGTGVDFIYVAATINGAPGGETPTRADAGQYASASAFGIRTLTDLVGGSTITVGVQVRTNSGTWAAAASNIANVNALAMFYR